MNINELVWEIRKTVPDIPRSTQVVVRFLERDYPIDCIQVTEFAGINDNEPARTVLAITADVSGGLLELPGSNAVNDRAGNKLEPPE